MSTAPKPTLQHADLTEKIIGAFYGVYNELEPGFLESVYKRSMAIALTEIGLKVDVEPAIEVRFHGQIVGDFRADIVVEDRVLLELKALRHMDSSTEGQILHYLRATRFEVGLLMNFGPKAEFRRFILENKNKKNPRNP